MKEATWLFCKACVHIWQAEWFYFPLCFASWLWATHKLTTDNQFQLRAEVSRAETKAWCWPSDGVKLGLGYRDTQIWIWLFTFRAFYPLFVAFLTLTLVYLENKTRDTCNENNKNLFLPHQQFSLFSPKKSGICFKTFLKQCLGKWT